jgi:hypothetical protein
MTVGYAAGKRERSPGGGAKKGGFFLSRPKSLETAGKERKRLLKSFATALT